MIDTKGITSKLSQLSVDRLNNFSDDEFFEFLGDVLSAKELLMNCSFDAFILSNALGTNIVHARAIIDRVCILLFREINVQTALSLKNTTRISSGIPLLDHALGGGLRPGLLYEIVGPAGAGKTQLSLLHTAKTILPKKIGGLEKRVIWLDTENTFAPSKVLTYMEYFQSLSEKEASISSSDLMKYLKNINVVSILTIENLAELIGQMVRKLTQENQNVSSDPLLIVIDSIAHVARLKLDTLERHAFLGAISRDLKLLAAKCNCIILVTNQVSASIAENHLGKTNDYESVSEDGVDPALGIFWAHAVNARISVQYLTQYARKTASSSDPSRDDQNSYRKICVKKSSFGEEASVEVMMDSSNGGVIVQVEDYNV